MIDLFHDGAELNHVIYFARLILADLISASSAKNCSGYYLKVLFGAKYSLQYEVIDEQRKLRREKVEK